MRQKLLIFGALLFLIVILVGLNAASYVEKEKQADNEFFPNRSTYNAGATGTRAFYDLLNETNRKVMRWQEPPSALLAGKNAPQTFVIVGPIKRELTETEATLLLRWVSAGGKLVIIDRDPPKNLLTTTANWSISLSGESEPTNYGIDPSDQKQMTAETAAVKPSQPTLYTRNITAVQPSRLASTVIFERFFGGEKKMIQTVDNDDGIGAGSASPPPPPAQTERETAADEEIYDEDETLSAAAPVVHLSDNRKNYLVDVPFGSGEIVYLADPFIVSNGGINLIDNAQLAVNTVASGDGLIAFDEYHHGYGTNNNRFIQYFAGTPVVAIFLQLAALLGLILFSQSRRFARALPEREPNRLSKLEYVAAMAELQRRTQSYDLAIENIYGDFRRRAARLLGADNLTATPAELANLIAERTKFDRRQTEGFLHKCEDIIRGGQTNKKEVLQMAKHLREIEEKLGLKRNRRTKT